MSDIAITQEVIIKLLEVELLISQLKSTQKYTMATKVRKLIVDARHLKNVTNKENEMLCIKIANIRKTIFDVVKENN